MKILVLGSNGMAGHTIALYFKEKGYDVFSFTLSGFRYCKNIIGDAFDTNNFSKIIKNGEFDIIINCIGMLNQVAEANHSKAIFINSYFPHFIVDLIKDSKTKLIHMSTDCVFAGNTGPYFENSVRDGVTFYDRTKAMGEIDDNKNLTFRNSVIGPDTKSEGIGLFNWFMKQNGTVKGYSCALWTGVTSLTLAKAMERAIENNLTGLYNLVNNESISKFDLLTLFNRYFRNNSLKIIEDDSFKIDKSLINMRGDFSFVVPSYEQMIIEMYDWVQSHSFLYPHYKKK